MATPTVYPGGGLYSAAQTVTLSSTTPGASISYTTDGTAASESHGTSHASPVTLTVASPETINAMAYEATWLDSAAAPAATYYFNGAGGGPSGGGGGPGSGTPNSDSGNGLGPRRAGVRALGSYWGASGENIDTASGYLNFSAPLIKPISRGSWGVTFMLNYNSQMWRNDSGGTWLLGQDTGYGMGWKLQAGSITPIWSSTSTIDHYLFTDATGAEYSLSVNNSNVWTSQEGIYLSYDAS